MTTTGALSVSSATGLITLVAAILGLGVAAQVLADRVNYPALLAYG